MAKKEKTLRLIITEQNGDESLGDSILTGNNRVSLVFPFPTKEATITYIPAMNSIVMSLTKAERIE